MMPWRARGPERVARVREMMPMRPVVPPPQMRVMLFSCMTLARSSAASLWAGEVPSEEPQKTQITAGAVLGDGNVLVVADILFLFELGMGMASLVCIRRI